MTTQQEKTGRRIHGGSYLDLVILVDLLEETHRGREADVLELDLTLGLPAGFTRTENRLVHKHWMMDRWARQWGTMCVSAWVCVCYLLVLKRHSHSSLVNIFYESLHDSQILKSANQTHSKGMHLIPMVSVNRMFCHCLKYTWLISNSLS